MQISLSNPYTYHGELFDYNHIYSNRLLEKQSEATNQALEALSSCLVNGNNICELADVKKALIERGVPENGLTHLKNKISDRLELEFKGCRIEINIPQFPRQSDLRKCRISVKSHDFTHFIETNRTPETVAEFLLKVIDWLPEYEKIEEELKQKLEQEKLAAQIAYDLLKKVAGNILDEKGYVYQIFKNNSSNKASLIINTSKAFSTTLEVRLLDNFYDDIVKHLEAMPYFESK